MGVLAMGSGARVGAVTCMVLLCLVSAADSCRMWEIRTGLNKSKRTVTTAMPVTEFPRDHHVIQNNVCGGAAYGESPQNYKIPASGDLPKYRAFHHPKPTECDAYSGGEMFYSYDTPSSYSSATGYETMHVQSSYFVQDVAGKTYWVLTQGKPKTKGNAGSISLKLSAPCLGNSNVTEEVRVLHVDDAALNKNGVISSDHTDCEEFYKRPRYADCAAWDPATGLGSFGWRWDDCCTDGMVLGAMPEADYCMEIDYIHITDVKYLQMGSWDNFAKELTFDTKITADDLQHGLQMCSLTCETHCSRYTTCSECAAGEGAGHCQWCDGTCAPKTETPPVCSEEGPATEVAECTACSAFADCGSCLVTDGCGWCYATATCMPDAESFEASCPRESYLWQAHSKDGDNTCGYCGGAVGTAGIAVTAGVDLVSNFCSGHGYCDTEGRECACDYGWHGAICNMQCPGGHENPCSAQGVCNADGTCTCHDGFEGSDCSLSGCTAGVNAAVCLKRSTATGICDADCGAKLSTGGCGGELDSSDNCVCRFGFWGTDCENACPGVDLSSGDGVPCGEDGTCSAVDGTCSCPPCMTYDATMNECVLAECSPGCAGGKGECVCNEDSGNMECSCFGGYGGSDCSSCLCQNGGTCSGISGDCQCPQCSAAAGSTFFGKYCEAAECSRAFTCSGNGECVDVLDTCICDKGWYGSDCSVPCLAETTCTGHGSCTSEGACSCLEGYTGSDCGQCVAGWEGYPDCRPIVQECRKSAKGVDYRGTVSVSSSGYTCQRWDSQTPHAHVFTPVALPELGLDSNYCRNPDADVAGPWCYVLHIDEAGLIPTFVRETCDIPRCSDEEQVVDQCVVYEVRAGLERTLSVIKAVTEFPEDHSIIANSICGNEQLAAAQNDYRIPADGQVLFYDLTKKNPPLQEDRTCVPMTGGEMFYAYEQLDNDRASHGYTRVGWHRMMFIQDEEGNAYWMATNNEPDDPDAVPPIAGVVGQLSMKIRAADIGYKDSTMDILVRDDDTGNNPDPKSPDACYFSDPDDIVAAKDCFVWNSTLGYGSFAWNWWPCCTDGVLLGRMPSTDFCFNIKYNAIVGIDGFEIGDWLPFQKRMQFPTQYDTDDMRNGFQICAVTCKEHCSGYETCGDCTSGEGASHCHWCDGACRSKTTYPQCTQSGPFTDPEECTSCTNHNMCGDCVGSKGCGWCYSTSSCYASQSNLTNVCPEADSDPAFFQPFSETGGNQCGQCGGAVDSNGAAVSTSTLSTITGSNTVAAFCNGHGTCDPDKRECECAAGYYGYTCDAVCQGGANSPCSGHGTCLSPSGVCLCDAGWQGADCGEEACPPENGICMHYISDAPSAAPSFCTVACGKVLDGDECTGYTDENDFCRCAEGWVGDQCDQNVPGVDPNNGTGVPCNGVGTPQLDGTCECDPCHTWDTQEGRCVENECPEGCGVSYEFNMTSNMTSNYTAMTGECACDADTGEKYCQCNGAFVGALCDTCGCQNGGICDDISLFCECPKNLTTREFMFSGKYCNATECSRAATCSGNGECVRTLGNKCVCDAGFYGEDCAVPCTREGTCSGHGACSDGGECVCNEGFAGSACSVCAEGFSPFPLCLPKVKDCATGILGAGYRGTINVTTSGFPCQRWDVRTPHMHSYNATTNPELAENYCRNPDGDPGGPWCYAMPLSPSVTDFSGADPLGIERESCNVPTCDQVAEPVCAIWTISWKDALYEDKIAAIRPVTHFPATHSVIASDMCGGAKYANDPWAYRIPSSGELPRYGKKKAGKRPFEGCGAVTGGEMFYSYNYPNPFSSDTGYEEERKQSMYIVQDEDNSVYWVITNNKPKSEVQEGGAITMKINAPDLGTLDPARQVSIIHSDDYKDTFSTDGDHCLSFVENNTKDCAAWDPASGKGSFAWLWKKCCTDGVILGKMPALDFCFDVEYTHIRSIETFQVGNYNPATNKLDFPFQIEAQDMAGGIKMCASSCEVHCNQFDSCGACTTGLGEGNCAWCDGQCVSGHDPDLTCDTTGPFRDQGECTTCSFKPSCSECVGTDGCAWCYSAGRCYDDVEAMESGCPVADEMWQAHEGCPANNTCGKCGGAVNAAGEAVNTNTHPVAHWCHGRGECDPDAGSCTCAEGWYGATCDTQCPGGAGGEYPGNGTFYGNPCSGQGRCLTDGTCACNSGWGGTDCSVAEACSPSGGLCQHTPLLGGGCTACGALLEDGSCGGALSGDGDCVCREGFWGADCGSACPGISQTTGEGSVCGEKGKCNLATGECVCPTCHTYNATDGTCDKPVCDPPCEEGKGECSCDEATGEPMCACFGARDGADCSGCACQNDGLCSPSTGQCLCPRNEAMEYEFFGRLCDQANCTREATCSGNGACLHESNECVCDQSYFKSDCSFFCDDMTTCNGHGSCCSDGCQCYEGYTGEFCDKCDAGFRGYPSCVVPPEDCVEDSGIDYRGTVARTLSGFVCQRWDAQTPHSHVYTPGSYPDAGLESNYCRNPDHDAGGPWCYALPLQAGYTGNFSDGNPLAIVREKCAVEVCRYCHPDARPLLELKAALAENNYAVNKLGTWMGCNPCAPPADEPFPSCGPNGEWCQKCRWKGIWCGRRNRVVTVDLRNLGLVGTLPDSLTDLTFVRMLKLQNNRMYGTIPSIYSKLDHLQAFNTKNNYLTGGLPKKWRSVQTLRRLNFRNNQLEGNLPVDWSVLSELFRLRVTENEITGELPSQWSAMTALKALSMGDTQLFGNLPKVWSTLTRLEVLNLRVDPDSSNPARISNIRPQAWKTAGVNPLMYVGKMNESTVYQNDTMSEPEPEGEPEPTPEPTPS